MTIKLNKQQCPVCESVLDAASGLADADAVPGPGDVTICFSCTALLEFTEDMSFAEFTDYDQLPEDQYDMIKHAQEHIRASRLLH